MENLLVSSVLLLSAYYMAQRFMGSSRSKGCASAGGGCGKKRAPAKPALIKIGFQK